MNRSRKWLQGHALFGIYVAAFFIFAADTIANTNTTVRVMCYNIHHGEGVDGQVDLKRIAAVITREKVDIAGLQEIDRGVKRTGGRDIIQELAEMTGMQFYFEKNITYQGGDYGNAILTRLPIISKTNTHYKMLRPKEQRGLQQMMLDVRGNKLLFLNTHIDYREVDEERMLNVAEMREIIARHPDVPVILVGDFNSYPNSRVHLTLKEFLTDGWEAKGQGDGFTYSSAKPDRRIDYIFYKPGRGLELKNIRVQQTPASDHMPIIADFELH